MRIWAERGLVGLAGVLVLAPSSCGRRSRAPALKASASQGALPIPEPRGLLAELRVGAPERVWQGLRALGGPSAELLPVSFRTFAAAFLGLPPLVASSLDGDVALVGALFRDASGTPGAVLGMHAIDGRELSAGLTTGTAPPFRAEQDVRSGISVLTPSLPRAAGSAIGVLGNYLLVAQNRESLLAFGAYVARELPKHNAAPGAIEIEIRRAALASEGVPLLRSTWQGVRATLERAERQGREAHGGRDADFADPRAALLSLDAGVDSAFSLLESVSELRLRIEPDTDRLRAELELTPSAGGAAEAAISELIDADPRRFAKLPREAAFALLLTQSQRERDAALRDPGAAWLRLLGTRISAADARLVREALANWAKGRGSSTIYGLWGGPEPALFLSTEVADAQALAQSGPDFLRLLSVPGIAAPLREFVGAPRVARARVPVAALAGSVERVRLNFDKRARTGASVAPRAFECSFFVDAALGVAAASSKDSLRVLTGVTLAARADQAGLGADPFVASGLDRVGTHPSALGFVDTRLFGMPAEAVSPLLFAFGREAHAGSFSVQASKAAVTSVVRAALEQRR